MMRPMAISLKVSKKYIDSKHACANSYIIQTLSYTHKSSMSTLQSKHCMKSSYYVSTYKMSKEKRKTYKRKSTA